MISLVEVELEYPTLKSLRPALKIVLPFCWKTSHLICYEHYWQNHQPIKFWHSMTDRPLGLATCPVLPPVLDRRFSQGSPRNESEIQWKQNDSRSHRRLYTRSCCPSTKNAFLIALFCRQKRITEKWIPKLNSRTKASKVFMHHFKDCNYESYEWLTASIEHKLFCWPWLLFNTSKGTWNDIHMDFIYKWQVSASLFDEYCIMHIVMKVYVVRW